MTKGRKMRSRIIVSSNSDVEDIYAEYVTPTILMLTQVPEETLASPVTLYVSVSQLRGLMALHTTTTALAA